MEESIRTIDEVKEEIKRLKRRRNSAKTMNMKAIYAMKIEALEWVLHIKDYIL